MDTIAEVTTEPTFTDGLILALRERLREIEQHAPYDPVLPDDSDLAGVDWAHVVWGDAYSDVKHSPVTVEVAREELSQVIQSYLDDTEDKRILLISAPAGLGKTHTIIETAQTIASRKEGKVGVFMDRHAMYADLENFPHFDKAEWWHWLPTNATDPQNPDNKMCLYHREATAWTRRGYGLMKLCNMICRPSGHIANCSYRAQAGRPEYIIAGVHEHAVTGMAIKDYELVIIDELPIRAFIKQRLIPKSKIMLQNVLGPVQQLLIVLQSLASTTAKGKVICARPLLDVIGPFLADVYAQVEFLEQWLPKIPLISDASQVHETDYWYLQDLLLLLSSEYDAWRNDWKNWLPRVMVSARGITLLGRNMPWKKLPPKIIILDATGNSVTYKMLFGRDVLEWKPDVQRKGHIYQVAERLNGLSQMTDKGEGEESPEGNEDEEENKTGKRQKRIPSPLSKQILSLVESLCKSYGYNDPGVVTHKAIRPMFEEAGFKAVHFYGQRGTNLLEGCDANFVVGSPSPANTDVMQTFAALNPSVMNPFVPLVDSETGRIKPVRTTHEAIYRYINERGQSPRRSLAGFWWYPELQAIYDLYREKEVYQALHRGRPLALDCDVWFLSTIETGERLDGFYATADKALGCPEGISWPHWMKISEWVDKAGEGSILTYDTLEELTGVSRSWMSRNKWLDMIFQTLPGLTIEGLRIGRGRRKMALVGFGKGN